MLTREDMEGIEKFLRDANVVDGIVRWNSNGNIPPSEVLVSWKRLGCPFDYDKSTELRGKEIENFLKSYAQQTKEISDEELYELNAAFELDEKLIDVITGKRIKRG